MSRGRAMGRVDAARRRVSGGGLLLGLLGAALTIACEDAAAPPGPPRCEPETELWAERLLKEGYRALLLGNETEARRRFERVLTLEPGHPEALRGLATPAGAPEGAATATEVSPAREGAVLIGEELQPFSVEVVRDRFDFETLRTLAPIRAEKAGPGAAPPSHGWFSPRAPSTAGEVLAGVDLIVLHDTHTASVAEAFAAFEKSGASTHFIVAADGTIFQTLDLSLEANHTRTRALDVRSIAIDLVNPVDLDSAPGSPGRPLSEFVSLQGRPPVQEHGYTEAQLAALGHLVVGLCGLVPSVPCEVPEVGGRVPREVVPTPESLRGVAGHLHVSPIAFDPGAGFPWERLRAALDGAR